VFRHLHPDKKILNLDKRIFLEGANQGYTSFILILKGLLVELRMYKPVIIYSFIERLVFSRTIYIFDSELFLYTRNL
jgi:hypothetical protein